MTSAITPSPHALRALRSLKQRGGGPLAPTMAWSLEGRSWNVLFLDFDGVLNTRRWINRIRESASFDHRQPCRDLDPAALTRVDRIVEATGALVVLTTNWRIAFSLEALRGILRDAGLRSPVHDEVDGVRAPDGGSLVRTFSSRETQIADWLAAHDYVTEWVALDDLSLQLPAGRLVQTEERRGLLDAHVERAIAVLK